MACRRELVRQLLVLTSCCVWGGLAISTLQAGTPEKEAPSHATAETPSEEFSEEFSETPSETAPESPSEKPPEITSKKASEKKSEKLPPERAKKLFSGKDLTGWEVVDQHVFDRHGKVSIQEESIVLEAGNPATGIRWKEPFPKSNYELRLEAKRIEGSDFFCGLTFPVGDEYCTFIVGGWGGGTTGLSNIDDLAAIENETTDYIQFQQDKWYTVRLRVTDDSITAWIDDKQMLHVARKERSFSIWWEQEPLRPLGISTWYTHAAIRNVEMLPTQ